MTTVLVITGNKREFDWFVNDNKNKWTKFVYVSSPEMIQGRRKFYIEWVGTYLLREDISGIMQELDFLSFTGEIL